MRRGEIALRERDDQDVDGDDGGKDKGYINAGYSFYYCDEEKQELKTWKRHPHSVEGLDLQFLAPWYYWQ